MPGRIYGLNRNAVGERFGGGYRFLTAAGEKLRFAFRVEFDADADEGMATVSVHVSDAAGQPLVNYEAGGSCQATVRTWVRAVAPGQPDPPKTPGAVIWRQADGSLRWLERDPLPDEALEELAAMGANVRHEK